MTAVYNTEYGPEIIAWREYENLINIEKCSDLENYVSAAAFVRFRHQWINGPVGGGGISKTFWYINTHIDISDRDGKADGDEIFTKQPQEIKVWNAVQKLIPSFKDYEKVEISKSFAEQVFSPLIPNSPWLALAHYKNVAVKVSACVLLLLEVPIRHFGVFIICRAMDLYSYYNPDFAEYYRFRAKINSNYPLSAIVNAALC